MSFIPLSGAKLIGFILASNRLLGRNFHFLKAVKPAAASPTTEATTMMAIKVVLFRPDVEWEEFAASAEADEVEDAVRVAVVTRLREE